MELMLIEKTDGGKVDIKKTVETVVETAIETVKKVAETESNTELAIVVGATVALGVIPGPSIIYPAIYGKVKRILKKDMKKKEEVNA